MPQPLLVPVDGMTATYYDLGLLACHQVYTKPQRHGEAWHPWYGASSQGQRTKKMRSLMAVAHIILDGTHIINSFLDKLVYRDIRLCHS